MAGLLEHNTGPVLVTRVDPETTAAVRAKISGAGTRGSGGGRPGHRGHPRRRRGRLASAIGGLVAGPVIAVPTSADYGALA